MNRIIIIGAGGHGRVVADIARLNGYHDIVFLDDADIEMASGKVSEYLNYAEGADFIVAIGNNHTRKAIQTMLTESNCNIVTLIHPNAVLGSNVSIGSGTVVMAGVVINAGAKIGDGVILNTCCSVDHDCTIEDYCHISVGAHLAGSVGVGKITFVCAGATIVNNITVCEDCIIGAGAAVVRNIEESGTFVGVPARKKTNV